MPMFRMIVSFDTSFSSNCSTITWIYLYDIPYHRISYFPCSNSFLELHPDLVGWRTSSIRREYELAKPSRESVDGYMHVVNVEYCSPVLSEGPPRFPSEAATAKAAAQTVSNTQKTAEYYGSMEEEMIRSLQRVGWRKVDVSFHAATWPFFAHNNLHVKREWLNGAGAGVIAHVSDSLKQQELSRTLIAANL